MTPISFSPLETGRVNAQFENILKCNFDAEHNLRMETMHTIIDAQAYRKRKSVS